MNFEALMQAARGNKTLALEKKEVVLKTKLAAPKKEEKKVDVIAIKKRLEEQQKATETKDKKPIIKTEKKTSAAQPSKPSDSKGKAVNGKTIRPVKDSKPKYEDKQHEEKHKKFMDNIQRMGQKAESKSSKNKHNDKISKKVTAKHKALVQPPSFKDLMALAEKAKTDPDVLLQANSKPNSPKPGSVSESKSRTKNSTQPSASKTSSEKAIKPSDRKCHSSNSEKTVKSQPSVKPSSKATSEKPKQSSSKSLTDKHSSSAHATKQTPFTSSQKPSTSQKHTNSTKSASTSGNSDTKSKNGPIINKRPSSSQAGGTEPKRMLSESAMAKLAHREGRRPPPPTGQPLSSATPNKPKYSKVMGALQRPTTSSNSNIQQSTTSQPKPSVQSKQSQGQENPVAKKKSLEPAAGVSAWDRIMGQPKPKEKSKKASNRYILSDDEEDDDMDDFIDDGDADIDYSAAIRDIFGYDKSRYRDEDFDDRSMVAGYADIMKEEVRSAKIGREEDLRDMQMEEEEKKRKRMMKKKK